MSRNLYSAIESKTTWDSNIKLSELACEELEFWLKHLGTLPCRVLSPFWHPPERVLFTDASSFAGAGVLLHSKNQVAHCMFNQHDKLQSSTYRELKALQFALVAFSQFLAGKFVKVYSVPKWESNFFWPSLVDVQTGTYKKFISEVVEYSNPSNFFVAGSQQNSFLLLLFFLLR